MKVYASICAMVLLFHLAVCAHVTGPPESTDPPTHCCFRYSSKPIPLRLLVDYYRTSERCSSPAIVFITRKGREICANPAQRWVQDYISRLEQN
ncbi:PREDICTED: C-C motif chemokine 4 homolog [Gekko japonicus]|uniref:C-C motif chemokine n=1 Tax=Gekko japonicus TaxID=146911 RepID=A0ABM1JT40_GEKJA|nr:PREDICTED: C-C motif chemokine 4 homolog [Gekko japonicus]XP_015264628.1 PREDICTED: C-C motif chemokine 4 homolog [Gekko japonicus]